MTFEQDWPMWKVATGIGSIGAIAIVPGLMMLSAHAQTTSTYPDVPSDYWAQPFIEELSQADILKGYPDGTFRPEQAIQRDEYAAVLRQAFDQESVRSLPQASTFEDVPENYWAGDAIEEAYEMGLMGTPEENEFEPETELTRVNAIMAMVEALDLQQAPPATAVAPAPSRSPESSAPRQQTRRTSNRLLFPLATTTIMQIFAPPATAAPSATTAPASEADAESEATAAPETGAESDVGLDLSAYYSDADQIPDYARDDVALATQAGLIANYPEPTLLNPNQPLSRGGTAALIHQALVYQNDLEPLPETATGAPYLVTPTATP